VQTVRKLVGAQPDPVFKEAIEAALPAVRRDS